MQIIKKKNVRVLKEENAAVFENKYTTLLNSFQGEVDVNVQYSDGCFVAIFTSNETVVVEEQTLANEFRNKGVRFVCAQCPHLETTGDKRRKRFPCKHAEYGTSRIDSECCEMFYSLLKQGKIAPKIGGEKL